LQRVGDHGWDNAVFRLGDDFAVRLPRRSAAARLIEHELRWLPLLAPRLPLPVPEPVVAGIPALDYPWRWAVVRWVAGHPVGTGSIQSTGPLLAFLRALHRPAPDDAPGNPFRGVPLQQRDARLQEGCAALAARGCDIGPIRRAWAQALAAEPYRGPPVWLHGDLHTANLLAVDGSISGVIDFGDLTAGDPACDYLIGWLLPPEFRQQFRQDAARHGPGTWDRARGWALAWSVAVLGASDDTPMLQAIGSSALAAVCAGDDATSRRHPPPAAR
jgi:aminoglycoside phosphotransferase (APT) family kinase protein